MRQLSSLDRAACRTLAVGLRLLLLGVVGCGAAGRRLHPLAGDEFGVFPPRGGSPPAITCSGSTDERFACFESQMTAKARDLEVGGVLALAAPDGRLRSMATTDTPNQGAPFTENTRFAAASVSKMFLGATAASLALEGVLDLQRPVATYVPELASDAGVGRASLHQLLTHTSGLGNPELCEASSDDLPTLVERHGARRLLVTPGAVHNYSNLGYGFVALALERATGKPFEDLVRERVTLPAGLPGASYGPAQVTAVRSGQAAPGEAPLCRAMWPSGGLVLSVRELARWASELANPARSRLGLPLIELLTAPHVPTGDRENAAYGYGVGRFDHEGITFFSHGGRLPGSTAFVAWSPARQIGVAAFANTGEPFVFAAGFRALSTFLSLSPDWAPLPGPAHPLAAYTGVYVDAAGTLGRVRISLEDGALALDYLDGPPPLLPATFRFVFQAGSEQPRYVVTAVGVGEREGAAANERGAGTRPDLGSRFGLRTAGFR